MKPSDAIVIGWCQLDAGLISPPWLIIAIVVLCQLKDIGTVHVHDEDLAGIQILVCDIGIAGECDPFAIGRETGAL